MHQEKKKRITYYDSHAMMMHLFQDLLKPNLCTKIQSDHIRKSNPDSSVGDQFKARPQLVQYWCFWVTADLTCNRKVPVSDQLEKPNASPLNKLGSFTLWIPFPLIIDLFYPNTTEFLHSSTSIVLMEWLNVDHRLRWIQWIVEKSAVQAIKPLIYDEDK